MSKELELYNRGRGIRVVYDEQGVAHEIRPKTSLKVSLPDEAAKRFTEFSEDGDDLMVGAPKGVKPQASEEDDVTGSERTRRVYDPQNPPTARAPEEEKAHQERMAKQAEENDPAGDAAGGQSGRMVNQPHKAPPPKK